MKGLKDFAPYVGSWHGRNHLYDPVTGRPDDSDGSATVELILKRTYLRIDYRWRYHGDPQDSSLLIEAGAGPEGLGAWWIDTWHMGRKKGSSLRPILDQAPLLGRLLPLDDLVFVRAFGRVDQVSVLSRQPDFCEHIDRHIFSI